jgi:hypothetical protein
MAMSALAAISMAHPTPMRAKRFASWRLNADGTESEHLDLPAETLGEAVALVTPKPYPARLIAKGGEPSFVILETDDTARTGKAFAAQSPRRSMPDQSR